MEKTELQNLFRTPTRQSWVAILMIIIKTYRVVIGQVWPFLILFLFGSSKEGFSFKFVIFICAVSGITMIYSIINFFRYYFHVDDEELIIESGVFQRSRLNVPFDRIQTINSEQTIVHRIFNVVRLKVDTAGSSKQEFVFQAISKDMAEQLSNLLLLRKNESPKSIDSSEFVDESDFSNPSERGTGVESTAFDGPMETILNLDFDDLIRAGIVQNHLRSGALILAFLFWIWESVEDTKYGDVFTDQLKSVSSSIQIFALLFLVFLMISFFISLVRMVITNYNLKFLRSSRGFKIIAGLFTRKNTTALDNKIQMIGWSDNPLKRKLNIKDLTIKQASSVAINANKSIRIPACKQRHIESVVESLYPEVSIDDIDFHKVQRPYWIRNSLFISIPFILGMAAMFYFESYKSFTVVTLFYIYLLVNLYLSYKKKQMGYNDEMLLIRGGAFGDSTQLLPIYKIQGLGKRQTPYQRRKNLANLKIHTASGSMDIPYLEEVYVDRLIDELLYKIERDKRAWM